MYLFDASSIINLVKRKQLRVFIKGFTLDLAIYEALNAIWKEYFLLKRIQVEVAYKLIEILSKVFNILEIRSIRGYEKNVIELAVKEGISIYDASYLYTAILYKATLVTDDKKLLDIARKYIDTKSTLELLTQ